MDVVAVLAAYDVQLRRDVSPGPTSVVERQDGITREVGSDGTWGAVLWSDLDEDTADAVIAGQAARFAGIEWEWKLHGHDRPADLPQRLRRAGLLPEPAETLLVADLREVDLEPVTPDGVRVVPVDDEAGVATVLEVHRAVFGSVHPDTRATLLRALELTPRPVEAVVAWAGSEPVCAGRVEFRPGTDFASLWGGGTLPGWRGRGVFRTVVAHRLALARARGVRYVHVDATDASRPVLERLGFVRLTTTTPWIGRPRATISDRAAER
ncbi:GNAT family N-acetyltransferase [Geodermatophilus ruber]|uniref:Acetyltransferase (GNAT) domain-containing protein n=1 Tax=Geodermatophilus ruber TaxID=504800 RepID=A0A1I4J470_9ACTN|nr:GNAT family N-acetyltransferase [Geodermatophilus ruber]SFL61350.1 Acetyltransferase (GNAT) domain-containing protein [Geodermatophilus ruber]